MGSHSRTLELNTGAGRAGKIKIKIYFQVETTFKIVSCQKFKIQCEVSDRWILVNKIEIKGKEIQKNNM